MKLTPKLMLLSLSVLLAAVSAVSLPLLVEMKAQVIEDLQRELRAIAVTAALEIDGDLHQQIANARQSGDTDVDESPAFQLLASRLLEVRDANGLTQDHIYTFYKDPADAPTNPTLLRFGVMTHPMPFIGDPYQPTRPGVLMAFDTASPQVAGLYEDKYGSWISAFAPILNSNGQITGVLAVDRPAELYFARYSRVRNYVIYIAITSVLLAAGLGWLALRRTVLVPVQKLHNAMYALAAHDFKHKLKLHSKDEFQDLATSLNTLSRQFDLASIIQHGFFPKELPSHPAWLIAGKSVPCDATGGDYYDAFTLQDGSLCLVLADVSGHGIGPSLLMSGCRSALRALSLSDFTPDACIDRLDRLLTPDLQHGRFITMVVAVLSPTGVLTYANAGHSPALLIRNGMTVQLQAHRPPLGLNFLDLPPTLSDPIQLSAGDRIFLASDGLTEAMDPAGNMPSGMELTAILQDTSQNAVQLLEELQMWLSSHTRGKKLVDDLTMLCVDVLSPN